MKDAKMSEAVGINTTSMQAHSVTHIFLVMVKYFTQLLPCYICFVQNFVVCSFAIKVSIDSKESSIFIHKIMKLTAQTVVQYQHLCLQTWQIAIVVAKEWHCSGR